MTRPRALLVALALLAGCGSATYNEGDTTDTTRSNRCGETGECEGSAPDVETFLAAACTAWGAEQHPHDWDLVDGCTELLAAAPTADVHAFLDRWLR